MLLVVLLALTLGLAACGESDPDPGTVLDRALTREHLAGFGDSPSGPVAGVVSVQALGYEDRVLEERKVGASKSVMADIRDALGADSGLRGMADNLEFDGTEEINGVETDHVSGDLDVDGLAEALKSAGAAGVSQIAGLEKEADLQDSLVGAEFDLFAGKEDGTIRRLDLTLAFDDPHNALPAARIRFSLVPDPSGTSPNQRVLE